MMMMMLGRSDLLLDVMNMILFRIRRCLNLYEDLMKVIFESLLADVAYETYPGVPMKPRS